jgi:hypothetical protein
MYGNTLRDAGNRFLSEKMNHKAHEVYHRMAGKKDQIIGNKKGEENNRKNANRHRDARRKMK